MTLVSSIAGGGAPLVTTYSYDAAGSLTGAVRPDGSALNNSYDEAHRLTGVSDNLGNRIAYTLDPSGNRTKTVTFSPNGVRQYRYQATFDALGRLARDIGGSGQTTVYGRDGNGNVTSVTDPVGRLTSQAFDPLNRLIQRVDTTGHTTSFSYNKQDRINRVTDPNGNATITVYDAFGDVLQTISPDSGTTSYRYNAAGDMVQRVDAAGAVTNFTYDLLERVLTVAYPADPAENVAYTYDHGANGRCRLFVNRVQPAWRRQFPDTSTR